MGKSKFPDLKKRFVRETFAYIVYLDRYWQFSHKFEIKFGQLNSKSNYIYK